MMRVRVRIFGEISKIYGSRHTVELEEDSPVSSVIRRIQEKARVEQSDYMGEWQVGSTELTININGKNIDLMDGLKTKLHDNDDIIITTYAVGG